MMDMKELDLFDYARWWMAPRGVASSFRRHDYICNIISWKFVTCLHSRTITDCQKKRETPQGSSLAPPHSIGSLTSCRNISSVIGQAPPHIRFRGFQNFPCAQCGNLTNVQQNAWSIIRWIRGSRDWTCEECGNPVNEKSHNENAHDLSSFWLHLNLPYKPGSAKFAQSIHIPHPDQGRSPKTFKIYKI